MNYQTSNAYMRLGCIEFERKNYEDAIKMLNKSLKYNPCNVPALFEIAECYKVQKEITKYYNATKKIYNKIYDIFDLAHYYRNLGYYYIERENWDLAKAVYLYSVKFDDNLIVINQINYILAESGNKILPANEKLTKILKENGLPTFISKENNNVIKILHAKILDSGEENSNVGKFLENLINKNANL